jgi:hypothetical protein
MSSRYPQPLPHRRHAFGHLRDVAKVRHVFSGCMEIRPRRQRESKLPREPYLSGRLEATVAADFDCIAPALAECFEKRLPFARRQSVAIGMREHCLPIGGMDPVDCLGKVRPGRGYVAGSARAEIPAECLAGIAHMFVFHQEAGEMASTYRGTHSGVARGARQAAGHANGVKLRRNAHSALAARTADGGESLCKRNGVRIDVEAHDVDGLAAPARGYFHTGNEQDIGIGGSLRSLGKTAGFVVIRQREQAYASRCRPADQFRRREHSIGVRGVGVQIDAQGVRNEGEWACIIAKPPLLKNL